MSFPCGFCGFTSQPGEKAVTLVTEIRDVVFPRREKAHRFIKEGLVVERDDPGGKGMQISQEALACPRCIKRMTEEQPNT